MGYSEIITGFSRIRKKEYKGTTGYKEVDKPNEWLDCPECGLKPIVWEFNNGRSTSCGCGKNAYYHLSIKADSIMSVIARSHNGTSIMEYDIYELRDNWNHYIKTGEIKFSKITGKW